MEVPTAPMDSARQALSRARARLLSWMQIRTGDRVLDVGCGAAVDTLALGSMVGLGGRVEGVDFDALKIAAAERAAESMGVSNWVHHSQCDVSRPLPFASREFDACCSLRFLEQLPDPPRMLAEMVRVTRPGGWIVALDTDWCTLSIDMPENDVERRMVRAKTENSLSSGYSARQMYRNLRHLGLSDIQVELFPIFFTNAAAAKKVLGLDRLEKVALDSGLVALNEIERWRIALAQAERSGIFFASVCLLLAGGRRPSGEKFTSRRGQPHDFQDDWPSPGDEDF